MQDLEILLFLDSSGLGLLNNLSIFLRRSQEGKLQNDSMGTNDFSIAFWELKYYSRLHKKWFEAGLYIITSINYSLLELLGGEKKWQHNVFYKYLLLVF